jgi:hypothetical protein
MADVILKRAEDLQICLCITGATVRAVRLPRNRAIILAAFLPAFSINTTPGTPRVSMAWRSKFLTCFRVRVSTRHLPRRIPKLPY